MKKIFVLSLLAVSSAGALAEGYAGASVGRGKLPFNCAQGASCDQSVNMFKLYAGVRLKETSQIDLGIGRIDAVEVAYLRTNGKASENAMVDQGYYYYYIDPADPDNNNFNNGWTVGTRSVPSVRLLSLDTLVLAPVLNIGVTPDVGLFFKAGFALVTSSVKSTLNGVSLGNESATKLKPYVGFGASYRVLDGVKVFGSSDWFQYSADGLSGTARTLNLGAEMIF
jgi:hypothetical protein